MMLHILNLSVDAADILPDAVPEDLSFNEIESIVEFVLEDVFHIQNALPEYDEQDEAAELVKTSIVYISSSYPVSVTRLFRDGTLLTFAPCSPAASQPTLEILSPPPKS
ncbi:MAG: hypothetical protein MUF71_13265 [Candidatus Kapabacteria bacterium]|nr:hypothetical protein [Candidatus Kapabacteria bacterium]